MHSFSCCVSVELKTKLLPNATQTYAFEENVVCCLRQHVYCAVWKHNSSVKAYNEHVFYFPPISTHCHASQAHRTQSLTVYYSVIINSRCVKYPIKIQTATCWFPRSLTYFHVNHAWAETNCDKSYSSNRCDQRSQRRQVLSEGNLQTLWLLQYCCSHFQIGTRLTAIVKQHGAVFRNKTPPNPPRNSLFWVKESIALLYHFNV